MQRTRVGEFIPKICKHNPTANATHKTQGAVGSSNDCPLLGAQSEGHIIQLLLDNLQPSFMSSKGGNFHPQ